MNKGNKTVLYLTRWYPSEADPMLGLFVRNHAKAATQAGYLVTVAYAAAGNYSRTTVTTEAMLTEVIVYYRRTGILSPILQLIAWMKAIRQAVVLTGKPQLIHAHILTRAGIFASLLSAYFKVPYLITEHWSRYYPENRGYKGFFRKLMTKYVIRKASAVTVVSNRLYNSMKEAGLIFKAEKLPNAVDTGIFSHSADRRSKFTFISITCFEEKSKNLKMLLDAVAKLRNQRSDFDLVMVGDGVDQKLIKEYGIKLGFRIFDYSKEAPVTREEMPSNGVNIYFTGTLTPVDTAWILKQSHCLVLSSNYETFGIVAYEAMASGLPVISTDVADLSQQVDKESGIIVPAGDSDSLSIAMETVMKNYGLYDAEKIRNNIVEKVGMNAVSGIIDSLYQKVIA